jgi:hypothetical protein
MMTLDEAREHVGEAVAYHPAGGKPEHGTIAGASTVYVFVQYPGERGTRATYPEDLTLIAEAELTTEAVAAVLTAAGERPAAPHESGWKLARTSDSTVLVNYWAAGSGEAVMKREALARWMKALGTSGNGWTVTGLGSRRLAWVQVAATAAGKGSGNG